MLTASEHSQNATDEKIRGRADTSAVHAADALVQAPAGVPTVITGQEKRVHETAFIWTKFM
jgi:hypothetical protein